MESGGGSFKIKKPLKASENGQGLNLDSPQDDLAGEGSSLGLEADLVFRRGFTELREVGDVAGGFGRQVGAHEEGSSFAVGESDVDEMVGHDGFLRLVDRKATAQGQWLFGTHR